MASVMHGIGRRPEEHGMSAKADATYEQMLAKLAQGKPSGSK
jgi:hypothetical protein